MSTFLSTQQLSELVLQQLHDKYEQRHQKYEIFDEIKHKLLIKLFKHDDDLCYQSYFMIDKQNNSHNNINNNNINSNSTTTNNNTSNNINDNKISNNYHTDLKDQILQEEHNKLQQNNKINKINHINNKNHHNNEQKLQQLLDIINNYKQTSTHITKSYQFPMILDIPYSEISLLYAVTDGQIFQNQKNKENSSQKYQNYKKNNHINDIQSHDYINNKQSQELQQMNNNIQQYLQTYLKQINQDYFNEENQIQSVYDMISSQQSSQQQQTQQKQTSLKNIKNNQQKKLHNSYKQKIMNKI